MQPQPDPAHITTNVGRTITLPALQSAAFYG
jgi:hypothetical protein